MQGDFLPRIRETKSILPQLVAEMNASGLPLLFYGAGKYAQTLYDAAHAYRLRISDVVVTAKSGNASTFMGYEIQAISDALEKYSKCNVLIAFQNSTTVEMAQVEKSLLNSGKAAMVTYYDGVHSNYYDELNLERSYIEDHRDRLEETFHIFADDFSRDIFTAYFNQRISGDVRYLRNLCTNDCYFPEFITLRDDEVFIDCGAYDGDSIDIFVEKAGRYSKIYAFEPDAKNFAVLLARGFQNLNALQKGCHSQKGTLRFKCNEGMGDGMLSSSGETEIEVDTIDNILQGERTTYIKMDIEGSEMAALEGAKNTIALHKPKLAVCVYHKKEDLITIPQKILSIVPGYKLYLRAHSRYAHELVLYAV